jgi:hypothetical protein
MIAGLRELGYEFATVGEMLATTERDLPEA